MKEQLISFETAKLAKEKEYNFTTSNKYLIVHGTEFLCEFDPPAYSYFCPLLNDHIIEYDESISAPSQSLLQKWLREIHNINVVPTMSRFSHTYGYKIFYIEDEKTELIDSQYIKNNSFEKALEIGLQEALKLIK